MRPLLVMKNLRPRQNFKPSVVTGQASRFASSSGVNASVVDDCARMVGHSMSEAGSTRKNCPPTKNIPLPSLEAGFKHPPFLKNAWRNLVEGYYNAHLALPSIVLSVPLTRLFHSFKDISN